MDNKNNIKHGNKPNKKGVFDQDFIAYGTIVDRKDGRIMGTSSGIFDKNEKLCFKTIVDFESDQIHYID